VGSAVARFAEERLRAAGGAENNVVDAMRIREKGRSLPNSRCRTGSRLRRGGSGGGMSGAHVERGACEPALAEAAPAGAHAAVHVAATGRRTGPPMAAGQTVTRS